VRVWAFAIVMVVASLVVAAPRIWPQAGAHPRAKETPAAVASSPTATATPLPEPSASPLKHRQAVLSTYACSSCHGVEERWLMPGDHAVMAESECSECHRPEPEPSPLALHDHIEEEPDFGECGLCHAAFARERQFAPESRGVCARCHGDETEEVFPASHLEQADAPSTCVVCHQQRPLGAPAVPHRTAGWGECTFCHGPARLTQLDGAHNDEATRDCLSCHDVIDAPAVSSDAHLPPAAQACAACHAARGAAPLPDSHDAWAEPLCSLCHEPAVEQYE